MDENTVDSEQIEEEIAEEVEEQAPKPPSKGRKFSSDSPDISEIMRLKKPNRRIAEIPLDSEITNKLSQLETDLDRTLTLLERERSRSRDQVGKSLAEGGKTIELQKKVDQIEAEMEKLWGEAEGSIVKFVFQDIGRKKYDDLVTAHPPTKEQIKEWEEEGGEGRLAYNVSSLPPALMAATAVDPEMTVEEATRIFDEWGNFEVTRLFAAAQAACIGVSSLPKSRRSQTDTGEITSSE